MKRQHSFKPTPILPYRKAALKLTDDDLFWRRLEKPTIIQEPGQVGTVDICPKEPHLVASTSSAKVQLYHPATCDSYKSLSRFKSAAYGGVFRADGNLLGCGDAEGLVRVFPVDKGSGTALRLYRGHQSAVHAVGFVGGGNLIASGSDDRSVRVWDMGGADAAGPVQTFRGHSDHVRSLATSTLSSHLIVSGSYDHCAMIWDTRTELMTGQVSHGCPIEAVLLFPNETLMATAGGTTIKVWDLTAGGKLLAKISQHHKTITGLRFSAGKNRLLSCSLDKHVKVYDAAAYQVVYTYDFTAPILSLALAPDDSVMAVGMAGGGSTAVLNQRPEKLAAKPPPKRDSGLQPSLYEKSDTVVKEEMHTESLRQYDYLLKSFKYSEALTYLLTSTVWTKLRPEVLVSFLKELDRRKGLERALAGRDSLTLVPLLRYLRRCLERHIFPHIIIGTAELLLKIYGPIWHEMDTETVGQARLLEESIRDILHHYKKMNSTIGSLDMILASSVIHESNESKKKRYFGKPTISKIMD